MDELRERRLAKQNLLSDLKYPRVLTENISRTVQGVMASVEEIRQAIIDLVDSPDHNGNPIRPSRADLETLHPLLEQILKRHGRLLAGAGFVSDPEFLQDAAAWLEWRTGRDGNYSSLDVTLDAKKLDNYDYLRAEWFQTPRDGAPSAIVGPYVDLGGTNAYVVTLTVPVLVHGTFAGVVGADLLVDQIEGIVRNTTRTIGFECPTAVVVTQEGRVLASNIPRQSPGTLLRELNFTAGDNENSESRLRAYECQGIPWKLVVVTCENPTACPLPCVTPAD